MVDFNGATHMFEPGAIVMRRSFKVVLVVAVILFLGAVMFCQRRVKDEAVYGV
jgi:hypothetical protein